VSFYRTKQEDNKMQMKMVLRVLLITLFSLSLTACRQSTQTQNTVNLNIDLTIEPHPPVVGESTLIIVISDAQGQLISDATLNIRGDMNHAGMVPVIRDVEGGEDGVYRVPFEWTMGGDWFIVVNVALTDGNTASQRFDITNVLTSGDSSLDMEHHDIDDGDSNDTEDHDS
jgi:hypothetical protein